MEEKQYYHHGRGDIYNNALLNTLDDIIDVLGPSMIDKEQYDAFMTSVDMLVLRSEHPIFYLFVEEIASSKLLLHTITTRGNFPGKKFEKEYQKKITENFSSYFPDYTFIGREHVLPLGRIDILARDKEGRFVIIEMKVGNKNATQQLIAYATCFEDPILISISETKPREMNDKVIYKTYSEIGFTDNTN